MKVWAKLEPGLYHSDDGELRVMIPELLIANGIPATDQNIKRAADQFRQLAKDTNPAARVVITREPTPTPTVTEGDT